MLQDRLQGMLKTCLSSGWLRVLGVLELQASAVHVSFEYRSFSARSFWSWVLTTRAGGMEYTAPERNTECCGTAGLRLRVSIPSAVRGAVVSTVDRVPFRV